MTSLLKRYHQFNLRIKPCKYGRGVFAGMDFSKGSLIEVCPVILMNAHEAHMAWATHGTILERYYFEYDEKHSAIALGYGSLYNHSKNPNADYSANTETKEVVIYARKNIKKGEQIFINYGYDPVKKFK